MSRTAGLAALLAAATSRIGAAMAETPSHNALDPAGAEAAAIADLGLAMATGASVIFLLVLAAAGLALRGGPAVRNVLGREGSVVACGIVLPALVLTAVLVASTSASPTRYLAPDASAPVIAIEARQWWWRVTYRLADGTTFEDANEFRFPAGQAVRLELSSADVIHSFWVPSLAGKIDMLPGRTTHLTVRAEERGTYRGQCAEFCGGPHGQMVLFAIVEEPRGFEAWVRESARRARSRPESSAGLDLFRAAGCASCHRVGNEGGRIGPNLTRVGARSSLGAGTVTGNRSGFAAWIALGQELKPQNKMPPFRHLGVDELTRISAYLEQLR